ncbi:MAG: MATE family efflux transporter [Oscillospiraceae bacterium]
MSKTNDLGKDKIFSLIIKLAVPAMIAQLVNVLYSIVDRMFIGNIKDIGDIALAGVGVCSPIVTLLTSFATLVGIGGSILMAMKMGEKNNKEAENILANSFLLMVIFSISLTFIFLLTKEKLLIWFGASDTTFSYANTYLTIYTIGTFFAVLALGLNFFITCQGFATTGMITVIIGAICNIILDYIFIFIFDMAVAGAALATIISQMLSCLYVLLFLFGKRPIIKIKFNGYSFRIIKDIIKFGLSPFIIIATDSIIVIIMNTVLQVYGGKEQGDLLISAATIVQSYFMLITCPLIGITSGTQAIISYNYGAYRTDRVKQAEKIILILALSFCSIMFAVSQLIPKYFVGIFTNNPDNISLAIWGIKTFTLAIIPMGFQYTFVDGLTALGKTKTALFLSVCRKTNYSILLMMLPAFLGAKSAFYAQPIADLVGGILSTTLFLFVFSKHLKMRDQQKVLEENFPH